MDQRKSITVHRETFEALQEEKRRYESWDEFCWRVLGQHKIDTDKENSRIDKFTEVMTKFVADEVTQGERRQTPVDELYESYRGWAAKHDYDTDPGKAKFGKALRRVTSVTIQTTQHRINGDPTRMYIGVEPS